MATLTANYKFHKDDVTDFYDVLKVNENLDKIDVAIKTVDEKADLIDSQLGEIANNSTKVTDSTTNGNILINDVETEVYQHPGSGTNPHGTTKADVGLGSVVNESKSSMFTNPTFTGTAKATSNTNYTTPQIRNITFGTTVPTTLANGEIYFMYE